MKSIGVALGGSWDVRWASSWARAVLIWGNAEGDAEEGAVLDVCGDSEGGSKNWVGIVRRDVSTSRNKPEPPLFSPFAPVVRLPDTDVARSAN